MKRLIEKQPMDEMLRDVMTEICNLAKARRVGLLFDAEQHAVQDGIDQWTLDFQRRYNTDESKRAIVYGTYQTYLRSTPETLMRHLAIAEKEGFTLGVKLVRGAYMNSDSRDLFWPTKEDTDTTYDGIAEALIWRRWNDTLKPRAQGPGTLPKFPNVSLVLASHNSNTVRKAMAMRQEQARHGSKAVDMAYAQLLGMADEVSCELIMASRNEEQGCPSRKNKAKEPKVYKYIVWGTVGQCLKYLSRRAEENKDAVLRAAESRKALRKELLRRIFRMEV